MANKIEKNTQDLQVREKEIQKGRFINQCLCDHVKGRDVAIALKREPMTLKVNGEQRQVKVGKCKICQKEFIITPPTPEMVDEAIRTLDTVLDLAKIMCPRKDDKAKEKFAKCQMSLKQIQQAYEFSTRAKDKKKNRDGGGDHYAQRGLSSDIYQRAAYTSRDND